MRPILMDNAFEAWAAAMRYFNDIKDTVIQKRAARRAALCLSLL